MSDGYDFSTHGNQYDTTERSLVTKAPNVMQYSPSYDEWEATTVRFFPIPVIDEKGNRSWTPYRRDLLKPNAFGDWLRSYAVVSAGDPSVEFILYDRGAEPNPDLATFPSVILYNAVQQAKKNKQDRPGWASLLERYGNTPPALSKPSEKFFGQVAMLMRGAKEYANATTAPLGCDGTTILFKMSGSAGRALVEACNKELAVRGPNGTVSDIYEYGDPIDWNSGQFVTFHREGEDPRQRAANQYGAGGQVSWGQGGNGRQGKGGFQSFECFMEPTWRGAPANIFLQYQHTINTRPWMDILRFPTRDEQANLLVTRLPADLIVYAFNDCYPQWIPTEIRQKAVAATQHVVPQNYGAGFGGAYGMPGGVPGYGVPGQMPYVVPPMGAPVGTAGGPPMGFLPPGPTSAHVAPQQDLGNPYAAPPATTGFVAPSPAGFPASSGPQQGSGIIPPTTGWGAPQSEALQGGGGPTGLGPAVGGGAGGWPAPAPGATGVPGVLGTPTQAGPAGLPGGWSNNVGANAATVAVPPPQQTPFVQHTQPQQPQQQPLPQTQPTAQQSLPWNNEQQPQMQPPAQAGPQMPAGFVVPQQQPTQGEQTRAQLALAAVQQTMGR